MGKVELFPAGFGQRIRWKCYDDPMDDAEYRALWRGRWLSSIEEMSSWENMRRTWLNPDNGNPHYSYVEYVSCYFDDLSLSKRDGGLQARVAEGLLTDQEANITSAFHRLFDEYEEPNGDAYDHLSILADYKWRLVTTAAVHARERLEAVLTDPEELKMLCNTSPSVLQASQTEGRG